MRQVNIHKIKIPEWLKWLGWIILLIVLFVSCGSIKKNKESTEVETDKSTNTEIKLDYEKDNFSFEPIDLQRPILVGGKEYHNTIIRYEKEKGTQETKQKSEEKTEVKTETKEKETDNTKLIIGVALALFLFLFLLVCAGLIFLFVYLKK